MFSWLDKRLKLKPFFVRPALPRGNAIWYYFPGIFTLSLLFLQMATGGFLFWQKPSSDLPGLAKNFHWIGANALMFFAGLHFLRNLWHKTYKTPSELGWLSGIFLFFLMCFSCITGSFLACSDLATTQSWIQKVPGLNPIFGALFQGKNALELHKIQVFHVSLLPLLILLVVFFHLWALQRAGISNFAKRD